MSLEREISTFKVKTSNYKMKKKKQKPGYTFTRGPKLTSLINHKLLSCVSLHDRHKRTVYIIFAVNANR